MANDGWDRLHDGKTYKIFRSSLFDFTVTAPDGKVIGSPFTLWGAHWAVRRHKRRERRRDWWAAPIVAEIDPGGDH